MAEPRQSVDSYDHSKPFPLNSEYSIRRPLSPTSEISPRPTTPTTSNTGHATLRIGEPQKAKLSTYVHQSKRERIQKRKILEKKYKRLYDEFRDRPMKQPNDFKEWNQHLKKEFNDEKEVQLYRDWVREQFLRPRPDVSLPSLEESISSANWTQNNDSMKRLNSVIISTRYDSTQKVQDLSWIWDKFRMGLKIDGQPLTPLPTESHTAEAYDVDLLSPGLFLGMRYFCVDNGRNQDVLVAPLGRIFLSPMGSNKDDEWFDAKLALMLEILEDGTAGKFLFSSMVGNDYEQLSDEMDSGDSTATRLPDQPKFTVALLDETVRLVPKSLNDDQDIYDKLKVESILEPLIVETGAKLNPDIEGALPIALFPLDETGQGVG